MSAQSPEAAAKAALEVTKWPRDRQAAYWDLVGRLEARRGRIVAMLVAYRRLNLVPGQGGQE